MGFAEKKAESMSVAEYLEGEKIRQIKHEFIAGEVYAMADKSDRHIHIAGNLAVSLDNHLGEDDCEVFISDLKLQASDNVFYYPDVMVACDGANADPYFRKQPRLIVEVTSPSTEQIDRTEKLSAYKQIKSLKEYVIVSQDTVRIDVYRRMRGDRWQWESLTEMSEELKLESVGLTLSVAQIYRRVKFPARPKQRLVVPEQ